MDLLFSRYASPFSFVDMVIRQNLFTKFVDNLIEKNNERYEWDYYIHRETEGISFNEFRENMKPDTQQSKKLDFEATVIDSKAILDSFNPQDKGGN